MNRPKINLHEIIFDVILFVYTKFFLYTIVTRGKMFYQLIKPEWFFALSILIAFFISWYVGLLLLSFFNKNKGKLYTFLSILGLWIPCSMSIFLTYSFSGISGGYNKFVELGFFGSLVGMIGGYAFGTTEYIAREGKSVLISRLEVMTLVCALFFFYLGFSGRIFVDFAYFPFICFILCLVCGIGGIKLTNMLEERDKKPISKFYKHFMGYIYPFIVLAFLCIWQELYLWGRINGALSNNEIVTVPGILLYLLVSGIIPVRIMMALQPPRTRINITLGFFAISYFVYSVSNIVDLNFNW